MSRHAKHPTLRALAQMVRKANAAWDGGEYAALTWCIDPPEWRVEVLDHLTASGEQYGREWIDGDGLPCDAVAIARRLLAAFRDAQREPSGERT